MKIEIDTNDRAGLKVKEAELLQTLAVVRFALNAYKGLGGESGNGNGDNDSQTDAIVGEIIAAQPNRFTSAAVRGAAGDRLTRAAIQAALGRATVAGVVRVAQRGVGRRPATYEKLLS